MRTEKTLRSAGEIRLVGGAVKYEGRVEYCNDGVMGTICDDGWTVEDAAVVCTMLGYPSEGRFNISFVFFVVLCLLMFLFITGAVAFSGAAFGQGTGHIVLADVECSGTESKLNMCTSGDPSDCRHSEDAGVRCIGKGSGPFVCLLKDLYC